MIKILQRNWKIVFRKFFSYPVNWIVVYYIIMKGLSNSFFSNIIKISQVAN